VKVAKAIVDARREKIARLLQKRRYLNIEEISKEFGISEATTRRDMNVLERTGRIKRMHGGALGDYDTQFASLRERERVAYDAKVDMAKAVYAKLKPNSTCFLDAGTSVLALARQLLTHPIENLTVITNSLAAIELLSGLSSIQLYIIGGRVLNRQSSIFGRAALETLKQWKFDVSVLSCWSFDSRGLWIIHSELADFHRAVLSRTRQAYCCADVTKLNRSGSADALVCSWKSAPTLVTDATSSQLSAGGVRLKCVEKAKQVGFYQSSTRTQPKEPKDA